MQGDTSESGTPKCCLGLHTSCPNISDRYVGVAGRVRDKRHDGKAPTFRGYPTIWKPFQMFMVYF